LAPRPRRPAEPSKDPRFQQVLQKLDKGAAAVRKHPPAAKKAAEASAAAKGPPNERAAGAKAKQVDRIEEAPTGKPQPDSFLAVLQAEIAKAMPKTLGDTEKFMKGGSSGELKSSLEGNVSKQTQQAASGVESASKAVPAQGGVPVTEGKPVPADPSAPPPAVNAAEGMPGPKPDAEVSLQASKDDVNSQMKEAEVTSPQLQKANDPRFSAVLTAKSTVDKQADAGPAKYRAGEQAVIAQTGAEAQTETKKGAAAMVGVQSGSKSAVLSKQQAAKAKDEAARKKITDQMEAIYADTKAKVEANLNSLETEVGDLFDKGVDAALKAMTDFVDAKLLRYKIDRYLSIPIVGAARWIKDQFLGLPDEVNQFYEEGRKVFTAQMNALVVRVAALVEARLKQAKADVADGQKQIQAVVAAQPKELQAFAQGAAKEVAGRFEELEHSIDDKKNQIAQQLAQKYKEGFDKADDALKKIQDENKGLVAGFVAKLGEVIKILTEFKNKLMSLLRKGADAIKLVLADPIGFLGNLLAAIKLGFTQFVNNIWTHLKKGFMTWLFGELADSGIEIPSDLSLGSILKLVLSVLGLTWERAKAEAVKMLGPTAVAIITKLVEYVQTLWQGGPAALWEKIKEDLSNLKAMVIDAIQDWLITTIVKRAVAKIVSLFNPVGAIIQAIMMIYQVVTFVIERANQVMAFVGAVINSITAIAQGAISGAANWIEGALGRLVPVLIGLLASLLGLGGIGAKIKETITKVQDLVWGAIRKFLKKAIDFVKKMWGKLTGKKDEKPDERTEAQKQADLDRAIVESEQLLTQPKASSSKVKKGLKAIQVKYKLTSLELVRDGATGAKEKVHVHGVINPIKDTKPVDFVAGMAEVKVTFNIRVKRFNPVPFRGQLRQQERGIKAMKMAVWSANRNQFLATKAASEDGSGRSAESAEDQRKFRELMHTRIVERRTAQAVARGVPKDKAIQEAVTFADDWLSRRAALHGPDQIAGGGRTAGDMRPADSGDLPGFKAQTGLVGLGDLRINSSIGSQWKSRIGLVDAEVSSDKYTPEDRSKFNMNVVLDAAEI
jgi:hypothetical protein